MISHILVIVINIDYRDNFTSSCDNDTYRIMIYDGVLGACINLVDFVKSYRFSDNQTLLI